MLFAATRGRFFAHGRSVHNGGVLISDIQFGAGFGHQITQGLGSFGYVDGYAAGSLACSASNGDANLDAAFGHRAAHMVHRVTELVIAQATDHRSECNQPGTHPKSKKRFEL